MQSAAKCLAMSMNDIFDAGIDKGVIENHRQQMADELIAEAGLSREATVWAIRNDMTKGLSEDLIDGVIDDPAMPADVRKKWKKEIKNNKKPYEGKTGQHARAKNYIKEIVSEIKPCPKPIA